MKKVFAVLMALSLILTMGVSVFADETGSITINNTAKDAEYTIYKMLDFTPTGVEGKGIYKIAPGWESFFEQEPATNYFQVVTSGGEKTVVMKKDGEGNEVSVVDQILAQAAIAHAKNNPATISPAKPPVKVTADDQVVTFDGLDLGYYAIDSTLGTLCMLTNTNSAFDMEDKNEKPDINKLVQEDSTMAWGAVNDADFDQQVFFKSELIVGLGATNYIMHDKMDAGLAFNDDVVVLKADGTPATKDADYTVVLNPEDGDTFDVIFDEDFIKNNKQTKLTITYSAQLTKDAVVAGDGNKNTVYLSYNENGSFESGKHTTTTYTWKLDVFKYTPDGAIKTPLAGAEFELTLGDTVIKFDKIDDETYKVSENGAYESIVTGTTGVLTILGLDADTYKLNELAAPTGYNKLDGALNVKITSGTNDQGVYTYWINDETPATIEVKNLTGGLFPGTGGIGTTIFYVVGGVLMVAALVILVSKKRMSQFA